MKARVPGRREVGAVDGLGLEGEVTHHPAGLEGQHVHSSETLLPGLDSSTEPMIIMGVWDTAREGHHHCSQGFWPEGRDLGL